MNASSGLGLATNIFVINTTIPDNKYLQIDIVMTNDGPSLKDISTMPNYQEFQLLSLLNHHRLIKDMFE